MSLLIKGANIVTRREILEKEEIKADDGTLLQIGGTGNTADTVIDADGLFASAGFIDIHTHGAGGADYMDATVDAFQTAGYMTGRHGVTTVIPTTLSATNEELFETFEVFEQLRTLPNDGADMPGLHLEGPYFAPSQMGAQDPKYVRNPHPDEYMQALERSDKILRWSIASELPGALEFGLRLSERGILPSIAHSDATLDNVYEAYDRGYRLITHLYCCTSSVYSNRAEGVRALGIDEGNFLLDGMYAECIGDGIHVLPEMLCMTYRIKGADRMVLCTDSMRAAGTAVEKSILGSKKNGREVYFADGVAKIAGTNITAASIATGETLLKTAVQKAKIPLIDAIKMLTSTPADIMGLKDRGSLLIGKRADITLFDADMNIKAVIVGEKIIRNDI